MLIEYNYANGEKVQIEVTEQLGTEIAALQSHEEKINRKESRRHISSSLIELMGYELVSTEASVEEIAINSEIIRVIREALSVLTDDQQNIIKMIYYECISNVEVAKRTGISKQALNSRLNKIFKKLKKK